jgi:hypothetical protein
MAAAAIRNNAGALIMLPSGMRMRVDPDQASDELGKVSGFPFAFKVLIAACLHSDPLR